MPGGIPVCLYEPEIGKFRVVRAKGKALSSGGYGVTWSRATSSIAPAVATPTIAQQPPPSPSPCPSLNDSSTVSVSVSANVNASATTSNIDKDQKPSTKNTATATTTATTTTAEYLFIEEVLFLHERGLIQAIQQPDPTSPNTPTQQTTNTNTTADTQPILDTRALYEIMLHQLHVPLLVYLTYSHLRSQTFIVLRHTVTRYPLLERLQPNAATSTTIAAATNNNNNNNNNNNIIIITETKASTPTMATDGDEEGAVKGDTTPVQNNTVNTSKSNGDAHVAMDTGNAPEQNNNNNEVKVTDTDPSPTTKKHHERNRSATPNQTNKRNNDTTTTDDPTIHCTRPKKRHCPSTKNPRLRLRRDIYEAPVPRVVRSTPPTPTVYKTAVAAGLSGTAANDEVVGKDERRRPREANHGVDRAAVDGESVSPPLRRELDGRTTTDDDDDDEDYDGIAFDVYNPNSHFRKTNPGVPDYYVSVTPYDEPSPRYSELRGLIRACRGVPLRMATVADGGTVVMFGVTDFGVPSIA